MIYIIPQKIETLSAEIFSKVYRGSEFKVVFQNFEYYYNQVTYQRFCQCRHFFSKLHKIVHIENFRIHNAFWINCTPLRFIECQTLKDTYVLETTHQPPTICNISSLKLNFGTTPCSKNEKVK